MRLLSPGTSREDLTADDVADRYPWPGCADGDRWVRAMMVTTLDGAAAGPDGLSGSVSSKADQAVFNAVRRFADVVLIGAGTMRAEEYAPMRVKPADVDRRTAAGQAAAPRIAVVSGSLDLPWQLPVWSESAERPLVITRADAEQDRLDAARDHAEVVALPATDPASILGAIDERGLRRVLCEGGPHLLRDLLAAGLVDEADITVSPMATGTGTSPTTAAMGEVHRFRLVHVLEEEDFLMTRYVVAGR